MRLFVCVCCEGTRCQHFSSDHGLNYAFLLCLTANVADEMCFCFRAHAQTPQTMLFDM